MIYHQYSAFKMVVNQLSAKTKLNFSVLKMFNKGRHALIGASGTSAKCWVIYKDDFFNKFSVFKAEYYDQHPEYGTYAESINSSMLKMAIHFQADFLVFVHPSKVYWQYSKFFSKYTSQYKLIRTQRKANEYKQIGGLRCEVREEVHLLPKGLLNEGITTLVEGILTE